MNQLQLTVADFVTEIHDTHHPISSALYYRQQKAEARRRTRYFRNERIPKFLGYFEQVLSRGGRGHYMAGSVFSYADLSMFQLIAGLRYAFPKKMRKLEQDYPGLMSLHDRVAARPNIAGYWRRNGASRSTRTESFATILNWMGSKRVLAQTPRT